jgi:hypothetical protein
VTAVRGSEGSGTTLMTVVREDESGSATLMTMAGGNDKVDNALMTTVGDDEEQSSTTMTRSGGGDKRCGTSVAMAGGSDEQGGLLVKYQLKSNWWQGSQVDSQQLSKTVSHGNPLTASPDIRRDIATDSSNASNQDISQAEINSMRQTSHDDDILISVVENNRKQEANGAMSTILNKNEVSFSPNVGKGHCLIFSFLQGAYYPNRIRTNIYHEAARAMRLVKTSKNIMLMSSHAQEVVLTWSDELIEKVFSI